MTKSSHKKVYPRYPAFNEMYFFSLDGIPDTNCYPKLTGVCKAAGISRSSVSKGKRKFVRDNVAIAIHELKVIKTKRKQ